MAQTPPTVTRFSSIFAPGDCAACSLADIIAEIRSDTHRAAVERARAAFANGGKANRAYAAIKSRLPGFLPGGQFSRRAVAGLVAASGIIQGDIDGLSPAQLAYAQTSLAHDPHTAYGFVSPSGAGYKFGFAIPIVDSNETYHRYFLSFANYILKTYDIGIDPACKSIATACQLTYDPDAYYNPQPELFAPALPPQALPRPMPVRPAAGAGASEADSRALDTMLAKIQQAPEGQRHHTRLKMAVAVGGMIAAGRLDATAASAVAEAAASNCSDEAAARRTVAAGLGYGQARPLYGENRPLATMYRREAQGARLYHG